MKSAPQFIREVINFVRQHWVHAVLLIPGLIAVTVPHEAAHGLAVWLQGGKITGFVCLPSSGEWGHISYTFPAGADYNQALISLAPYILWLSLWLIAGILALRPRQWSFAAASTVFVWLFLVPAGDLANAAVPYVVLNNDNDLFQAFGNVTTGIRLLSLAALPAVVWYGMWLNRRLYRENALGRAAYLVLATVAAIGIAAVTLL